MNKATYTRDAETKTLTLERDFDAPRSKVWEAFTKSEILEKWIAPKPMEAHTVSSDFREGGHWHCYMVGPDGVKMYSRFDYETIDVENSYTGEDSFCDEAGKKDESRASNHWNTQFTQNGDTTKLRIIITFASAEDIEKTVASGFQESFSMGFENLDEILAEKK